MRLIAVLLLLARAALAAPSAPAPPTVIVTNTVPGTPHVRWDAVADGLGYQLFYGTDTNSMTNSVLAGTNTVYGFTNLTVGTRYWFAVSSYILTNGPKGVPVIGTNAVSWIVGATITQVIIESSPDVYFTNVTELDNYTVTNYAADLPPAAYYRARINRIQ